MTARPSCFVLGNCTHISIREYLRATGLFSTVDSLALFEIKPGGRDEAYATVKKYDYVFSIVHGHDWGVFEAGALKKDFGERAVLFTGPFFTGLHPDVLYISKDQETLPSPFGYYHSGLAFWGFMTGRPVNQIIEMYHDAVLPEFFELEKTWERGIKTLEERDRQADILSAEIIDRLSREKMAMLTINHPSMDIIAALCAAFCEKIFQKNDLGKIDYSNLFHDLTADTVIPVLPAVLRAYQLTYQPVPTYKCGPHTQRKGQFLTFAEVAKLSYDLYATQKPELLVPKTPGDLAERLNASIGRP